jgi:hypothetical protein
MEKSRYECVDRNGTRLEKGQTVRVQHCVGRYGQTRTVTGTLDGDVDLYGGMQIVLGPETRAFSDYTKFGTKNYKAGEPYYVASVFSFDHATNRRVGYSKFDDYEHGHESWVEIVK